MTDTGATSPTAASSDGTGTDWVDPTNVYSDNGAYATVTAARRLFVDTSYLIATGFGFSIPTGATINGIKLEIERKKTSVAGGSCNDANISLTKDGSTPYGNTADANGWTTSDAYYTWGSATEMWGESFTPAEINDANFGAMFSATVVGGTTLGTTASVDHVRITVYYTEAAVSYYAVIMTGMGG